MKEKLKKHSGDIVVAGAGAAGIAAAISAARHGAKVSLIEKTTLLGGTVTHCLIHTLGGIHDSSGRYLNEGLPIELTERLIRQDPKTQKRKIGRLWTLSVSPDVYKKVVETWIGEEKNIKTFFEVKDTQIEVANNRIQSFEFTSCNQRVTTQPAAVIDTTGNAEIIKLIDKNLVIDNEIRALAGLIFQVNNIKSEHVIFPRNISISRKIRKAAEDGLLPGEFSYAWIDRGVYDDEAYVKLSVLLKNKSFNREDQFRTTRKIDIIREHLLSFLRQIPEFSRAKITHSGTLGIRDGGRFQGEYLLSATDVRSLRKFSDGACRCSWPIEYWDPEKGIELEYLRSGDFYEIPLRSLKVRNIKNLWAAGKCISADHIAQASARVVGSCWAMGEAVGKAVSGKKHAK